MKGKRKDDELEKALLREVFDAMNFMIYLWIKGGHDMSKAEMIKLKRQHYH